MLSLSALTLAVAVLGWVFYRGIEVFTTYKVSAFGPSSDNNTECQ